MAEHVVVKPEKIAATAAVLLEESLTLPALFQREGIDAYRGAKNDTINVVVEGVLPWREYGWRNNRSAEIVFDEYAERTIAVTFGGDIYNGVKLTDEQNEMDLFGWTKLARKQTEALGHGLNYKAATYLKGAPYEVEIGIQESDLRGGLVRIRQVANKLRMPGESRKLVVGTAIEAALLNDDKLNLAQNVGEAEAVSALRAAHIGARFGLDIVVANEIAPNEAYVLTSGAFIFATAAPAVPQSVPFGATASYNGVALRWLRDYDSTRFQDRSIFNCYQGFRHVTDVMLDEDNSGQLVVGTQEHFVRAFRVELGMAEADEVLPPATGGTAKEAELRSFTGLQDGFGL
jgi:hypothetical protein